MKQSRRHFLQQTAFAGFTASTSLATGLVKATNESAMRLILLGTAGGPTPKKNRAAPAQLIMINDEAYLIDCGNGVAQQVVKAGIKLSAIRHVFLTHHHSDHNADYGNLMLLAWAADLDHRIDTYGPPPLKRMTQQFLALNDYDIQTRIHDEGRRPLKQLIYPHELQHDSVVMQNQHVKVSAARVVHPPVKPAFAYRFDHQGKSIVISGDTSYSENLVRLAQGANILVHEIMHTASLDQLLATEPNATRLKEHLLASHSTAEQVGRVATQANVKKLVLSHFVPGGYPYLEDQVWLDAVRPYFDGEIIVGSDLMEIQV
ncbi:MBL fold metallo-hydrolase [Undibacterium seohonense]|uniref:MBL fold metallo-hydrolase n=1 Tax=Undibacterium seohonense TaxID=1344950 RepID=A0ABR6WZC0_9BURK|nr:MBL fold metallo-hydrolase [Undibacterium seohonense]MBC3805987.1 MBL fold metallo-hydrolase [Undibacterium seohonense]